MHQTHTTNQGDKMRVCEMTNSHLANQIKHLLKAAEEVKTNSLSGTSTGSKFMNKINGTGKQIPEEVAADFVMATVDRLDPYMFELCFREQFAMDLEGEKKLIMERISRLLERTEGIVKVIDSPVVMALTSGKDTWRVGISPNGLTTRGWEDLDDLTNEGDR